MGLDAIIRAGLTVAHSLTADLQTTVSHAAWSSADGYGEPTYATAVSRTAIVEQKVKAFRTVTGEDVVSTHRILFLQPVTIDVRDKLTIGTVTAPILSVSSVLDPTTTAGYYAEVYVDAR